MALPQEGIVRLGFDPDRRRWLAVNLLSAEVVELPQSADQWNLKFSDGSALFQGSAGSLWFDDLCKYRVAQAESGDLWVVDAEDRVSPLRDRVHEHILHKLHLKVNRREQTIAVYVYAHPCAGCTVWWSFRNIFAALALDTPMREAQWRETWWPWWSKMLENLGYGALPHLRRATPSRPCFVSTDLYLEIMPTRHLEEATCSTPALIAITTRASVVRSPQSTSPTKKKNESAWQELLDAIFESFVRRSTPARITMYLDTAVVCEPLLPLFGKCPVALTLDGLMLDLQPLQASANLGERLYKTLGGTPRVEATVALQLLFAAGKSMEWAFKQLLHIFAAIVERVVLHELRGEELPRDMEVTCFIV